MIKIKILSPIFVDGLAYQKNKDYFVQEQIAELLVKNNYAKYVETEESTEVINFSELKVSELKQLLIEKGIEIPKGAKKKDLVQLLEEMK